LCFGAWGRIGGGGALGAVKRALRCGWGPVLQASAAGGAARLLSEGRGRQAWGGEGAGRGQMVLAGVQSGVARVGLRRLCAAVAWQVVSVLV
jgi:hypothetical protein